MRVLVFDTKSNSKPKSYKKAEENVDAYPYLMHVAGTIIEYKDNNPLAPDIVYTFSKYIKPYRNTDLISITKEVEELHSITAKTLMQKGEEMKDVVYFMQGIMNSVDLIVSHNFALDRNVIAAEILRQGFRPYAQNGARGLCTMRYFTKILKIPVRTGKHFKFPRLDEVYKSIFDKALDTAYSPDDNLKEVQALVDIVVTLFVTDKKLNDWVFNYSTKPLY